MELRSLLPLAAGVLVVATTGLMAQGFTLPRQHRWKVPALLSLAFGVFSLRAIVTEGLFGFWTEHTRNEWGNQIWFDLLLAIGIAWFLIVPHAKSLGMKVFPWLALVICTGCVGLTAMLARMLYLRDVKMQPSR